MIVKNINLDELISLLSSIRAETNFVDMEINGEKEVVFIPKKSALQNTNDEIKEKLKEMKEEYEKEKNKPPIQLIPPVKKENIQNLDKLA